MGVFRCALSVLRRIFGGLGSRSGTEWESGERAGVSTGRALSVSKMDAAAEQMVAEQDAEVFPDIDWLRKLFCEQYDVCNTGGVDIAFNCCPYSEPKICFIVNLSARGRQLRIKNSDKRFNMYNWNVRSASRATDCGFCSSIISIVWQESSSRSVFRN